jgi:hypothetical protein
VRSPPRKTPYMVARYKKRCERSPPRSAQFRAFRAHLAPPAPDVYGRYPARAKAQSRARLASPRNIPRSASLDGTSSARATLRHAHGRYIPRIATVLSTRLRRVHVAFKAVNTLFVCSQRNKKLLTSAQQNCSTPFFRCRNMTPQQHLV